MMQHVFQGLLAAGLLSFSSQETSLPPTTQEAASALELASPEARETWMKVLAASRDPASPAPLQEIRAFVVSANVEIRDGVGRNSVDNARYSYLAPEFIRFSLESGRETGRGPELGAMKYWLKDGDRKVPLHGREYEEDRKRVDEAWALARNFLALADLSKVRLAELELLASAPNGIPSSVVARPRQLIWLTVKSPDFALVAEQRRGAPAELPTYAVELGLDPKTYLPALALVREERPAPLKPGEVLTAPVLVELERWSLVQGHRVPKLLRVFPVDGGEGGEGGSFAARPGQVIALLELDLAPKLTPADFNP